MRTPSLLLDHAPNFIHKPLRTHRTFYLFRTKHREHQVHISMNASKALRERKDTLTLYQSSEFAIEIEERKTEYVEL